MHVVKPSRPGFPVIERRDEEHGHLYVTPAGEFWGATTFIGVIDKPVLRFWYASQERAHVIEAAADLWEDAPHTAPGDKKMSRTTFVATLKKRIGVVKKAQKELEKAQTIGTQAHALVEWELRREMKQAQGPRPKAEQAAEYAFESWQTWRASVELEPLHIEQTLYSKEHEYAGTADLIAFVNLKDERHDYGRTLAVIDWKTGKRHYPESSIQSAAYSWALHEMGHAPDGPPPGLIIRMPKIKKDPGFDPKVVHTEDFQDNFEAFLNAKALWWWLQAEEARMAKAPAPESIEELIKKTLKGQEPVEGVPF